MAIKLVEDRFALQLGSAREGGMGKVFKVRDINTGKSCALKVMDGARRESPLYELAMQRELDALHSLSYPHIVSLVAHGNDDELGRFVVMDWLEQDLKARCKDEPYADWNAFWQSVGAPILGALCYAFIKGRIHRDLKPANIMFDDAGDPKLIDFGISGMLESFSLGMTLQGHRSEVYSPPEDGAKGPLRDVYGFAATAVYAMTGVELESREHLLAEFERVRWPEGIGAILARCLAQDPDDRPETVVDLREQLERTQPSGEDSPDTSRTKPTVFLRLPPSVEQHLRDKQIAASLPAIVAGLNGAVFVEWPRIPAEGDPGRMVFVTGEITVTVTRDKLNPSVLVILAAKETRPTHWSFAQERSLRAAVQFRVAGGVGRVEQSDRAIDGLLEALAAHDALADLGDDQSVFEVWRTVLRGRAEYYGRKFPALVATSLRAEGMRIVVKLAEPPDTNLAGLSYFVDDGISRVAVGEVESVQDDGLTLYCTAAFDAAALTDGGRLRYNAAGTEKAIRNQEQALDRVQSGTSPNPELARYVSDPSVSPPPVAVDYELIVSGIDVDKQRAARAAMGSEALFLVVGPPGTGKTEFITELVLQEVQRNPSVRILLSAQTHMAVDNALARIKETRPTLSCVRLGRPTDRISRESSEFLLDKVAPRWRAQVSERCLQALDAYGRERGVDVSVLRAHRVARRAYTARREFMACKEQLSSVTNELVALREKMIGADAVDAVVEIDELEDALLGLRNESKAQQLRVDEAESEVFKIGQSAADILQSLEQGDDSTGAATATDQVDGVLANVTEWLQRLAVAHEFFPAILAESQVVAGTCLGFIGVPGTSDITYDLAIVEEASRALPSEVLVPASRAKRIVLVGDGRQLPPFLESDLLGNEWLEANSLTRVEVAETLFDRLEARLPESAVARLRLQYRMHRSIGDLVAHVFYPGTLESAPDAGTKAASLIQLGMDSNVLLVSTSREPDRREKPRAPGFANTCEVRVVRSVLVDILKRARKKRRDGFSIVLLAPYVAHRGALEQAIAGLRSEYRNIDISVHTVHTFQGRQADIAIYSCVRSNGVADLGFTRDPRLLNVALSRGRGGLIVVGDVHFLGGSSSSSAYRDLIAYVRGNPDTCRIQEACNVG